MTKTSTRAHERRIERELGVTHAGLVLLSRAAGNIKRGQSRQIGGGNAAARLVDQKYAVQATPISDRFITDDGLGIVKRARAMGW